MAGAKDKIKQYLDYKGISRNKFYSKTGLSIGFLESGVSMGIDKAKIIINNFPDISLEWLVMDQGDMTKGNKDVIIEDKITAELLKTKDELIELQKKYIEKLETSQMQEQR